MLHLKGAQHSLISGGSPWDLQPHVHGNHNSCGLEGSSRKAQNAFGSVTGIKEQAVTGRQLVIVTASA